MTTSQEETDSTAILRRYLEAINAWDFAAMRELLHVDISYELPYAPGPFPRVTKGLDNVMAFLESVPDFAEEENLSDVVVHELADDVRELVAEYRSNMKLTSGQPYANSYVVRATIRDGRILRFVEYFDPVPLIVAIGGSVELPGGG
jgi:ketosteroid isomerase-like protein